MNVSKIFYVTNIVLIIIFCSAMFYVSDSIPRLFMYVLYIWGLLTIFICNTVYWQSNCPTIDSVRIPLDVVMLDNQIDYWRGKLCFAQNMDDTDDEVIALLHIDIYQEIRRHHGLTKLPNVT